MTMTARRRSPAPRAMPCRPGRQRRVTGVGVAAARWRSRRARAPSRGTGRSGAARRAASCGGAGVVGVGSPGSAVCNVSLPTSPAGPCTGGRETGGLFRSRSARINRWNSGMPISSASSSCSTDMTVRPRRPRMSIVIESAAATPGRPGRQSPRASTSPPGCS